MHLYESVGFAICGAPEPLRTGSGLVSVATRAPNAAVTTAAAPEIMVRELDAGADLRLNPDPSVTINGTVNPDFATIEADREV